MKTRFVAIFAGFPLAIGIPITPATVHGHEGASITFTAPPTESAVRTTFVLQGVVAEGGGGLVLTIDGKGYLTPEQRRASGDIPSGTVIAETSDGISNAPFSLPIDLSGPGVVASGPFGKTREPIPPGKHVFKVCQLYGPHSGCSQELVLNVTAPPRTATTVTPAKDTGPKTVQAPTAAVSVSATPVVGASADDPEIKGYGLAPAALLLMLTLLGLVLVVVSDRFNPARKPGKHER